MKKSTSELISKCIKRKSNYKNLTSKQLSRECNVSASTITRYVKQNGYKNFEEFKFYLIEKEMQKKKKSKDISIRKIENIIYSLKNIEDKDFEICINQMEQNIINNNKIIICYEDRYDKLAEIFINKMNLLYGNIILIQHENDLEYLINIYNEKILVFSIGRLKEEYYREQIQYIEIKYVNKKIKEHKNKGTLNLLDNASYKNENTINTNFSDMLIVLEILLEKVTKKIKTKQELLDISEILN